jgi:spore germination protein YaaH
MFILSAGVPKEKLILSIPTYGLSFVLNNENKYSIGDKITEQGSPGRISNRAGLLASEEVIESLTVPFTFPSFLI